MLPTIDISLIGVLLAIWNVFRVIWDYTSRAFNWITQRALALLIGSKLWATAFLVAAVASLLVLLNTVFTFVISFLGTLAVNALPVDNVRDSLKFAAFIFPVDELLSVLTMVFTGLTAVFASEHLTGWWLSLLRLFGLISRSHKM